MNPLADLVGKDYDNLTNNELIALIDTYCDDNRYDFIELDPRMSRSQIISTFVNKVNFEHRLISFFNDWTK